MQAEYQSVAGPGCGYSKGQVIGGYLLKRHSCVNSIENHAWILSRFFARLRENLQNPVPNFGMQLYSAT